MARTKTALPAQRIMVIDIGGTSVKLMLSEKNARQIDSGNEYSPGALMKRIREAAADWAYDSISLGFPAAIRDGKIIREPTHLSPGWIGFNFRRALGKSVKVVNDAAMQALGSYHGRRMLFLGLGTGLGSALVWNSTVLSLELGHLPYPDERKLEDRIGKTAYESTSLDKWERDVFAIVRQMKKALIADYVVLGGGLSQVLRALPEGTELGHNRNAFLGGQRLWQTNHVTGSPRWRIL
jgi:predicted NBD/HSP70 family sugar kinase